MSGVSTPTYGPSGCLDRRVQHPRLRSPLLSGPRACSVLLVAPETHDAQGSFFGAHRWAGFQTPPGRPLKPPGHSWGRTTQGARHRPGGRPVFAVFQVVNRPTVCVPVLTARMQGGGYDHPGAHPTWLRCPCPIPAGFRLERAAGHGQTCPEVKTRNMGHFSTKGQFYRRCRLWSYSCTAQPAIRLVLWAWARRDTGREDGPTGSP